MSCKCREEIGALLAEHCAKREGVHKVVNVELEGYGMAMTDGGLEFRGRMDATVHVETKLKSGAIKPKKVRTFVQFTYCPFCGEPVDKKAPDADGNLLLREDGYPNVPPQRDADNYIPQ